MHLQELSVLMKCLPSVSFFCITTTLCILLIKGGKMLVFLDNQLCSSEYLKVWGVVCWFFGCFFCFVLLVLGWFSPENIMSERETPVFSLDTMPCHSIFFLAACQRVFVHLDNTNDLVYYWACNDREECDLNWDMEIP